MQMIEKKLHPKIHEGILNKRNNKSHKRELIKNNFDEIDLVIVNLSLIHI